MTEAPKPCRAERCPQCNSPSPERHPAVQSGGEVSICPNDWHKPASAAAEAPKTAVVPVPREQLEALTRLDNSIATAIEVREWAYRLLANRDPQAGEAVAWLIEAPGANYLAVRTLGRAEFYWTTDPNKALRFFTKDDAHQTAMAVRRMEPELWAFALTLGEAWPREHKWLPASPQDDRMGGAK